MYEYCDGVLSTVSHEPTVDMLFRATVRTECRDITEIPECVVLCRPIKKEGDFTSRETKNEFGDSELSALLETFIRVNMEGQSDTRVLKVFQCGAKYLVKTNSRYCENIKREHSSNHIKLVIEAPGTIHQECFCKCETLSGRRKGFCKDFKSR